MIFTNENRQFLKKLTQKPIKVQLFHFIDFLPLGPPSIRQYIFSSFFRYGKKLPYVVTHDVSPRVHLVNNRNNSRLRK